MIYIKEKFCSDSIHDVIDVLKEYDIKYWLDHGSLLGIIRDGKFIEWDGDIDIGAWNEIESKVISVKQKLSKKYKYVSYNQLTNAVSVRFLEPKKLTHWSIDIVFYYRENGRAVKYYVDTTMLRGRIMGIILTAISGDLAPVSNKNWINNFFIVLKKIYPLKNNKIIDFIAKILTIITPKLLNSVDEKYFQLLKNNRTIYGEFNIPDDSHGYLELRYGMSWKTPKKNWDYLRDDGGVN